MLNGLVINGIECFTFYKSLSLDIKHTVRCNDEIWSCFDYSNTVYYILTTIRFCDFHFLLNIYVIITDETNIRNYLYVSYIYIN